MKKTEARNEDVYSDDVFQVLFDYEIARARRYPSPIALLQIEMKSVALDAEAARAAPLIFISTLNKHLRSVDITARSGNVFRVLLPNTDEIGGRVVCERILSVFKSKFEADNGASIAFSLQIGGAFHHGGDTMSSTELMEKAGEALKQSKLKGANTYAVIGLSL